MELRLRCRWAAASVFSVGLRSRRGASGVARTGCGLRIADRRAACPVRQAALGSFAGAGRCPLRRTSIGLRSGGTTAERAARLPRRSFGFERGGRMSDRKRPLASEGKTAARFQRLASGIERSARFGAALPRRTDSTSGPIESFGLGETSRVVRSVRSLRVPKRAGGTSGFDGALPRGNGWIRLRAGRFGGTIEADGFVERSLLRESTSDAGGRNRRSAPVASAGGARASVASAGVARTDGRDGSEKGPTSRGDRRRRRRTATR
jgi:hypothetical protein